MESAAKIKEILQAAELEKLPDFIAAYQEDPRNGVQKLVALAQKNWTHWKGKQRIENLKNMRRNMQDTLISAVLTKWAEDRLRDLW